MSASDMEGTGELAASLSALDAAEKLETQYKTHFENIEKMKETLDDKKDAKVKVEKTDKSEKQQDYKNNSSSNLSLQISFKDETVFDRLTNVAFTKKAKQDILRKQGLDEKDSHKPEITKPAKSIVRTEQVEDILLRRKDEYNAHLEEMRREIQQKELSTLSSPRINKMSKEMTRTEPAYTRLYDNSKQTLAKKEILKKEIEEKELQEIKSAPAINQTSKKMSRSVEAILQWEKEKKLKKKKLKEELVNNELKELKKPKINPISEKIAKQMNRNVSIAEHLLSQFEQKQMEKEQKMRQQLEVELMNTVPLISPHSANLKREGQIYERLYHTFLESENKKRIQKEMESLQDPNTDTSTGQKLYSPSINPKSAALVRYQPVEEILQKRGEESNIKRKQRLDKELKEYQEKRSNKIGAYSQLLVDLMEKRTQTSTQDRLTKPIGNLKQNASEDRFSHRPFINDKSREIDQFANHGAQDRLSIIMQKATEYDQHKKKLADQIMSEKLSECTFSPRALSPTSKVLAAKHASSGSIVDRSKEWLRRLDSKLKEERSKNSQKDVEECTFHPTLNQTSVILAQHKRSSSPNSARSVNSNSSSSSVGYMNHTKASSSRSLTPPMRSSSNLFGSQDKIYKPSAFQRVKSASVTPPRSLNGSADSSSLFSTKEPRELTSPEEARVSQDHEYFDEEHNY